MFSALNYYKKMKLNHVHNDKINQNIIRIRNILIDEINKFDSSSRFSSNRIELVDISNSFANSRRYAFVEGLIKNFSNNFIRVFDVISDSNISLIHISSK